ncbi:MAG TPA: 4-oxalocrotonate tautomerase [Bacillales bacterium]|nr:4-oxalocrotonate tautomerase [Bacillales bacterium]
MFCRVTERRYRMPIINIQVLEGRPEEKIEELIKNVTDTVSETLDAPKENVRVLVAEMPKTHWGIGGVSASKKGR